MKSHRKWVVPKLKVISSFINSIHIFYCTYFTFYWLHSILIIFIVLFYGNCKNVWCLIIFCNWKRAKGRKPWKKGRELLTLQCSTNCAVKTKTSGQASLLSSSLPMAGAEHRMKMMMWTAGIKVLKEDMIVAVVITILRRGHRFESVEVAFFFCNCLNCYFSFKELSSPPRDSDAVVLTLFPGVV